HEGQDVVVLPHLHAGHVAAQDLGEDVVRVVGAVKAHGGLLRDRAASLAGDPDGRTERIAAICAYMVKVQPTEASCWASTFRPWSRRSACGLRPNWCRGWSSLPADRWSRRRSFWASSTPSCGR